MQSSPQSWFHFVDRSLAKVVGFEPIDVQVSLGDVAEGPGSRRDHLHATISASEKAVQSDKATELYAEMQHNGLEPDGITLNGAYFVIAFARSRGPFKPASFPPAWLGGYAWVFKGPQASCASTSRPLFLDFRQQKPNVFIYDSTIISRVVGICYLALKLSVGMLRLGASLRCRWCICLRLARTP